ncbi:MAG: S53 family peptidase [Candidatus Thermoplasmatota archaeon]|nr:S53 family peptidase [Candidatus Thermoplasmatota archaeon]
MIRKQLVLLISFGMIVAFSGLVIPAVASGNYQSPVLYSAHGVTMFIMGPDKKGGGSSSAPTTYPGYIPIQIWDGYQYTSNGAYNTNYGSGETIAVIDAYGSPSISSDVKTFDSAFGLPAINLQIVQPFGKVSRNSGWALETSLDVEWAHAMAPAAKIVLIETPSASNTYLINDAVNYAYNTTHANIISMSWGEAQSDLTSAELAQYSSIFSYVASHGVIPVAASGDNGASDGTSSITVNYPSTDPSVVSAGGTSLVLNNPTSTGASYGSEYAWNSSGGGISTYFPEPSYQSGAGISASGRASPDVSYDANPNTGVWVYDTTAYEGSSGWIQVGGTSAAAPQWSAIFADIQSIDGTSAINGANVHQILYSIYSSSDHGTAFHDITVGYNGYYYAGPGYDEVTGIGSPIVYELISLTPSF